MPQTLLDIVTSLRTYDPELTIYVRRPWSCDALSIVAREPEERALPAEATAAGAAYFLEVFLALEFLEGWIAAERRPISFRQQCERLIAYAVNDA